MGTYFTASYKVTDSEGHKFKIVVPRNRAIWTGQLFANYSNISDLNDAYEAKAAGCGCSPTCTLILNGSYAVGQATARGFTNILNLGAHVLPYTITLENGSYYKFYLDGGSIKIEMKPNGGTAKVFTYNGDLSNRASTLPFQNFQLTENYNPYIYGFQFNDDQYVASHQLTTSGWTINTFGYPCLLNTSTFGPAWGQAFFLGLQPVDEDDPYQDIDDSAPSGPAEGSGIPESDPIDFPSLPSFSVTDTGFITLFNPTMTQVKNLADYMWNGLFDVNTFKKLFADPMDCILGFNMVPVPVPAGAAANINIGNIITSVSMNVATAQWVEVDCGSIDIGLPYGSYLDYSPYTKFSIYLPYIGTCDLSTDDVAGKVLTLKYHVDVLSCSCVAYLKCGNHVLYQWTGACGYSIPITQNDFSRMIMSIISIAAAGIGGAVTGGAGAAIMNAGASAAKNVMNLKPEVHRSGTIGSGAGLMGGQTPYLIIEIPNACKPKKQYHYLGYPGFITTTIGDISGYAEFESVILDGIGCTSEERQMIESYCSGGIYV